MNLHECAGIIVVIATNTDIMFSARALRSVEEAIIINVKRYEVHIEWHRLIDVIGRLSCSITPSHDIRVIISTNAHYIYRILFPGSDFLRARRYAPDSLYPSRVFYATQIPPTFVINFFNGEAHSRFIFYAHLFFVRYQRQLILESVFAPLEIFRISVEN